MYTKRIFWIITLICSFALLIVTINFPAMAAPTLQLTEFPTPTPGADGRILYIVQENDTLWRISAITGINIDELRRLNNLTGDDILRPGQSLLLGYGGPAAQETAQPSAPTQGAPDSPPTPTPGPGTGTICILVYEDVNGDAARQETEMAIPQGAVSLTNRLGSVSLSTETLSGEDPVCFEDVLQGDYNVSAAVPDGYNPTTVLNYSLSLEPGDTVYLDFGAQVSTKGIEEEVAVPDEESGRSSLLGIIGIVLLLGGLGLGLFAGKVRRRAFGSGK